MLSLKEMETSVFIFTAASCLLLVQGAYNRSTKVQEFSNEPQNKNGKTSIPSDDRRSSGIHLVRKYELQEPQEKQRGEKVDNDKDEKESELILPQSALSSRLYTAAKINGNWKKNSGIQNYYLSDEGQGGSEKDSISEARHPKNQTNHVYSAEAEAFRLKEYNQHLQQRRRHQDNTLSYSNESDVSGEWKKGFKQAFERSRGRRSSKPSQDDAHSDSKETSQSNQDNVHSDSNESDDSNEETKGFKQPFGRNRGRRNSKPSQDNVHSDSKESDDSKETKGFKQSFGRNRGRRSSQSSQDREHSDSNESDDSNEETKGFKQPFGRNRGRRNYDGFY